MVWPELNENWPNYGSTPILIIYDDPKLCQGRVTYDALVGSGADVVILSDPAGGLEQYKPQEIEAIRSYIRDGHGVVGSFLFEFKDTDDRELLPLFGLPKTPHYGYVSRLDPTFHIMLPRSPLLVNLPDPFTSEGYWESMIPPHGSWGPGDLIGAEIVARTEGWGGIITAFHDRTYDAAYVSTMPEYHGGMVDEHLWYNMITAVAP